MAWPGSPRLLQLPRSADQWSCPARLSAPRDRPLAAHAAASQPKGSGHVGTDDTAGGGLAPETDHPPSMAQRSLCRHTPEVGAVCEKDARTVLCGGRAMKRASLPLQRREFISLLGGAAGWPVAARAQPSVRRPTLGLLIPGSPAIYSQRVGALVQRLRELGWVDGATIAIEYRWAATQDFDEIAAELVSAKVDIIFMMGTPRPVAA